MATNRTRVDTPQASAAEERGWADRRTALVTGASSGIGRALALLIASNGFDLVLVGQNRQQLALLAETAGDHHGRRSIVLPVDLSKPAGAQEVYDHCLQRSITPEILVNNAGSGLYGLFTDLGIDEQLGMIQLNITTLTHLTRLFLPPMIARRRGYILNVASTAAFQPGPLMAGYYASKSYVVSMTVALAQELKGSGVFASVLCPGPTKTEFHKRAGMKHTKVASMAFMSAQKVARCGFEGMLKKKTVIIPGFLNKIGAVGVRLLPMALAAKLIKQFHQ